MPGPATTASPPSASTTLLVYPETLYPETQNINQVNTLSSTQQVYPLTENVTNTGAAEPQSEPPSKQTCSRHRASTASPMHSIHTSTQANVLPSTQIVNPEDNDALNTPPGDASTISDNLLGIQRANLTGTPSKRTRSAKKQESRHKLQQFSQDTSRPSVNQRDTLPETL
eukprot:1142344-Pelagomonas_calceolata.AAC.1